jgi:hypothetical protein
MPSIPNARVLIVATDGFEEWELFGPRQILQQRGADVVLASLKRDPIQATIHDDPGKTIRPDLVVDEANADDFDALSRSARSATGPGSWSKPICCAVARQPAGRPSAPTFGTPAQMSLTRPPSPTATSLPAASRTMSKRSPMP